MLNLLMRAYAIMCRKNNTAVELFDLFLQELLLVLRQQNGIPLELISGRGKIFTSKFFKECTTRLGISLRLSSARSQQTNGKAERKSQHRKNYLSWNILTYRCVHERIQSYCLTDKGGSVLRQRACVVAYTPLWWTGGEASW